VSTYRCHGIIYDFAMKSTLLYFSIIAAIATPLAFSSPPAHANNGHDQVHVVAGYAWNDFGTGYWSEFYSVIQRPDGSVSGSVTTWYYEYATEETPEFTLKYTVEVECISIDMETKTAWLGGYVVESTVPDFLPVGTYMVDYAHDGGPGGENDTHGGNVPSWFGGSDDCAEHIPPYAEDPVQRGNIVVK